MKLDVVIFGGGAAGLWLLDHLTRRHFAVVLLEAAALGEGQTVASQGIIHGGMKYMLGGLPTASGRQIRRMPELWRKCLLGQASPNLSNTQVRSQCCYLWQEHSWLSWFGMQAARMVLRVPPKILPHAQRPPELKSCPGIVARLPEQVIAPCSFVADLFEQYRSRILRFDSSGCHFDVDSPGNVNSIRVDLPGHGSVEFEPKHVVFTAGAGNALLRKQVRLDPNLMQCRPLHMVMLRGKLPQLNGHCVHGSTTRVTITSDTDSFGNTVWQAGGQLAENGVSLSSDDLLARAEKELQQILPDVDFAGVEWSTYRCQRAERVTKNGLRPSTAQVSREGNVITAWPTKLALAPQLVDQVEAAIDELPAHDPSAIMALCDWPRPDVALPPWEKAGTVASTEAAIGHATAPPFREASFRKIFSMHPSVTSQQRVTSRQRALGKTGLSVSSIGYGALKIGRNQGMKYPQAFELPSESESGRILNACLDLGINFIDTASAYGLSEERIGKTIAHRRSEYVLSSKAGEIFENGQSRYDYRPAALRVSVESSLASLRTDVIDVLFIHTKDDLHVQNKTDAVATFQAMKMAGLVRFIGLSAKTPAGAEQALSWADALMVEYNFEDRAIEPVIAKALSQGVGIVVKKGLGSGHLAAEQSIAFVLGNPGVASLVVGSLSLEHLQHNLAFAERCGQ